METRTKKFNIYLKNELIYREITSENLLIILNSFLKKLEKEKKEKTINLYL